RAAIAAVPLALRQVVVRIAVLVAVPLRPAHGREGDRLAALAARAPVRAPSASRLRRGQAGGRKEGDQKVPGAQGNRVLQPRGHRERAAVSPGWRALKGRAVPPGRARLAILRTVRGALPHAG